MSFQYSTLLLAALYIVAVLSVSSRVIMRRPPSSVALAWMVLVAFLPLFGVVIYLLVGERRVGLRRAKRIGALRAGYAKLASRVIDDGLTQVQWDKHRPEARGMDHLGMRLAGIPTVAGSSARFISESGEILKAIAADIDSAQKSVLMEFYIWSEGGDADLVLEALIRAAKRGVSCRLLVDAVGARPWWGGKQPQQLRDAGVKICPALPVGLLTALVSRNDLRLHRKIVVVDGQVAWTGSMNLVDPRFFKQSAKCGEWVDAMVRMEGAAVAPLTMTMIGDWMLETAESLEEIMSSASLGKIHSKGNEDVQVVASGPGESDDGLLQMLLAVINSAREVTP